MSSVGPTSPDQPADLPSFQRSDARRRRVVQGSVCLAFVASATWTLLACKRAGNGSITIRQAAATLAWLPPVGTAFLLHGWQLPTTLALLCPLSILPPDLPSLALEAVKAWTTVLLLLAGCSRRGPEMVAELGEPSGPTLAATAGHDDDDDEVTVGGAEDGSKKPLPHQQEGKVSDPAQASVLGLVLFQWPLPLIWLSHRVRVLAPHHLPILPRAIRARVVAAQQPVVRMFAALLRPAGADQDRAWRRLLGEIWRVNRGNIRILIVFAVVKALLTFVPAYLLSEIIHSLEVKETDRPYQISLCLGLAGAGALSGTLASQATYWEMAAISKPVHFQLRTLLFEKTLRRKDIVPTGQHGHSGGKTQVMNLFTLDVPRIAGLGADLANVSTALVDLVIGTSLLYSLLGYSAFIGLALNLATIPFNKLLADYTFDVDRRRSLARDERISAVDEVLAGIRGVKFEAGEDHWEARIEHLRREEVRLQRVRYWLGTFYNLIWGSLPVLAILVSLTSFALLASGELTPHVAFPALAIFNGLQLVWTAVPSTMTRLVEAGVSLKRLAAYLGSPEVGQADQPAPIPLLVDVRERFELSDVSFTYPADAGSEQLAATSGGFRLRGLSLGLFVGKLNLVVGPVAAGKSLFLLGLLGEADQLGGRHDFPLSVDAEIGISAYAISGSAWLTESTAYVPQSSWLQNTSIRDNILFGLPFNRSRYEQVLNCCCLRSDLLILADGDQTEIGERGLTLSGGQKARVSLARAVYSRARHLLIDDCLSAVDAHTAQAIFAGLQGPLLADRTLVLCTHHVSLCLPAAHAVVALKAGELVFSGDGQAFAASPLSQGFIEEAEQPPDDAGDGSKSDDEYSNPILAAPAHTPGDDGGKPAPARKLVAAERREIGGISLGSYVMFVRACGGPFYWLLFATAYLGTQALDLGSAWWLRRWTSANTTNRSEVEGYLLVYALITFAGVAGSAVRWIVLYDGATSKASVVIHQRLLHAVIRAPMRYFETTAHGVLLNRFGGDMSRVDGYLPDDFARCVIYSLSLGCSVGILCAVAPLFSIAVVVLAPVFYIVGRGYVTIARDFRRLESVSSSPLYGLFAEVIGGGGIAVIRAYGCTQAFRERMLSRQDDQTSLSYHAQCVFLWLVSTFALLNSALTGCAAVILILLGRDAAATGFALTWALQLGPSCLDLLLRYASLELTMVSVERIQEFSTLPAGAPEITSIRPPPGWPTAGAVRIEDLTVRYADDLPDVLKGVSFDVAAGEKVGLVGASGSGKSTIALSLFRMVEARAGRIVIDGLNIAQLGTQDLRSGLTIIPQDPSLVSGTLRSTLDLRHEHPDEALFAALRRVHLLPSTTDERSAHSVFRSLDTPVAQHGSNFSLGERQLLVLARALLRDSKLLILDEATSSIDFETDELITHAIAEAFAEASLLVVAHRLRTIIRFDKVLVLAQGEVVESDAPRKLLADPTSAFFHLCRKSGELELLRRLANE